jgi:hypothetical protein
MSKILNAYKKFIKRTDNPINVIYDDDLKELNELEDKLLELNLFNNKYYDDFINWICDEFSIECCFTCGKYLFKDNLYCCVYCFEYICIDCKKSGCNCKTGDPDEDDYDDNINCYYL